MYCTDCSNVLLRKSDNDAMGHRWYAVPKEQRGTDLVMAFYTEIEANAPLCPCGGHFMIWANVKCPHCHKEIPYNKGIKDPKVRAFDSGLIILKGAMVVDDTPEQSWIADC